MSEQTQKTIDVAAVESEPLISTAVGMSGASIYQSFAHSAILMYENAVAEQQRGLIAANASLDVNLRELLALGAVTRCVADNVSTPIATPASLETLAALMQAIE